MIPREISWIIVGGQLPAWKKAKCKIGNNTPGA